MLQPENLLGRLLESFPWDKIESCSSEDRAWFSFGELLFFKFEPKLTLPFSPSDLDAQALSDESALADNISGAGAIGDISMDGGYHEVDGESGRWTCPIFCKQLLIFSRRPAGCKPPAASTIRN